MREAAEQGAIEELRAWMRVRNLQPEGEPIIAYYDAPFIPGPLRRNEAMLRVRLGSTVGAAGSDRMQ
jgi:hypothetical protein